MILYGERGVVRLVFLLPALFLSVFSVLPPLINIRHVPMNTDCSCFMPHRPIHSREGDGRPRHTHELQTGWPSSTNADGPSCPRAPRGMQEHQRLVAGLSRDVSSSRVAGIGLASSGVINSTTGDSYLERLVYADTMAVGVDSVTQY